MGPIIVGIIIAIVGLFASFMIARISRRSSEDPSLALLQNQVNSNSQQTVQQIEALRQTLGESLQALNQQVTEALSNTNRTVGDRLDATTKVVGDVRQQLGRLEESSKRMEEVGKDIASLEDILKPPKLRGSLGELFLADLLS